MNNNLISLKLQKDLNFPTGKKRLAVELQINRGQLLCLYGKSGVGKTSILRMLAGLLLPNDGRIKVDGKLWFDQQKKINLTPQEREVGMVFQDYALFPNMTVEENLKFALHKDQKEGAALELIDIMELGDLRKRKPNTLSGGQQQRVALARALVQRPTLLLLDEPLSALDTAMRKYLQAYILKMHQSFGLTTILVSHDEAEVRRMADVVVLLEDERVMKIGTPDEVFGETSPTASGGRGPKNFLTGIVEGIEVKDSVSFIIVSTSEGTIKLPSKKNEVDDSWIGKEIRIDVK